MKGIPIKFRAWCKGLGKWIYMNDSSQSFIIYNDSIYYSDVYDDHYLIEPDDLDQLVGYDAEGNEVYEGDTVLNEYLNEFKADEVVFNPKILKQMYLLKGKDNG